MSYTDMMGLTLPLAIQTDLCACSRSRSGIQRTITRSHHSKLWSLMRYYTALKTGNTKLWS